MAYPTLKIRTPVSGILASLLVLMFAIVLIVQKGKGSLGQATWGEKQFHYSSDSSTRDNQPLAIDGGLVYAFCASQES